MLTVGRESSFMDHALAISLDDLGGRRRWRPSQRGATSGPTPSRRSEMAIRSTQPVSAIRHAGEERKGCLWFFHWWSYLPWLQSSSEVGYCWSRTLIEPVIKTLCNYTAVYNPDTGKIEKPLNCLWIITDLVARTDGWPKVSQECFLCWR